jgi:hypothetical protein
VKVKESLLVVVVVVVVVVAREKREIINFMQHELSKNWRLFILDATQAQI